MKNWHVKTLLAFYLAFCLAIFLLDNRIAQAATSACTPTAGFSVCYQITPSGSDQTLVIPSGVSTINARVFGAAGGGANISWYSIQGGGAGGGYATGTIAVVGGQTLTIVSGQGGVPNTTTTTYGGGGAGGNSTNNIAKGGSGGGMSGIFNSAAKTVGSALIVAGGGGGASPGADANTTTGPGGGGGTTGGQDGQATLSGRGGTQVAGGTAATGNSACLTAPTAGAQFQGGAGGASNGASSNEGGGGGGGGYFGGGGGLCQNNATQNGGGGGGSSFIAGTGVGAASTTAGGSFLNTGGACAGTSTSGGAADSLYVAGTGQGSCYGTGGNGLVIIQFALPTVTVTKTSNGAVGGFTFTGSNGWTSQTVTTVTSGTAATGAKQVLTAASVVTTITEAIPAGYALNSAVCTGLGAGGTAVLSGSTITLDAAATAPGSNIACTFTNTKIPTISIQKTTTNGFGGPFTFTQTGLPSTPATITTSTASTPTPAAPGTINATIGTTVALTEAAAAGFSSAGVTCTDSNSAITGNPVVSSATAAVTIPAANIKAGATYNCVFTNTKLPTLQLTKISNGGTGGFTFTGTNGWTSQTITTVTAGTAASGTAQTLSTANTATTLTEAIPAGYAMTAASCSGLGAGTATPNLAAGTIALDAAATAPSNVILCSITNSKNPTITVQKTTLGGFGGPFTFTQTGLPSAPASITTSVAATPTPAAPTAITATPSIAVTLTEGVASGYATNGTVCTDSNSAVTGNPEVNSATATVTIPSANIKAGASYNCVFTNALLPKLTLRKTTSGGVNSFNFSGTNGFGSDTITTVVAGTPVTGTTKTLTLGNTATDITETVTAGYFLNGAPTCTGMGAGGTVTLVSGTTYRLDAAATANGSAIVCSFSNTVAAPQLSVTKTANRASVNVAGQVITYTIVVSNPGNVAISTITVTDPRGAVVCAVSGNATIASLAPAASQNCTLNYTVTQNDLNTNGGGTGIISNTALAAGNYGATAVSNSASASVNIIRNQALSIVKTSNTPGPVSVGAVITYTYKVTNSGNVTMSGVKVSDAHNGSGVFTGPANETLLTDVAPTGDSTDAAVNGIWDTLAPGDVVTFTATYVVTQQDVDTLQ